jgi:uncharacterized protein YoxC
MANEGKKLDLLIWSQQEIRRDLAALRQAVTALHTQGDKLMAISKEMQDAMAAIDDATNTVAARITDLSGQISTGMTQADVDAVVARLNTEASKLNSIAADPSQPVPPSVTTDTTGGTTDTSGTGGTPTP